MARLEYEIIGTNSSLSAAIKSSISSISALDQSVSKTNKNIQNEISSIKDLQNQLKKLNQQKINIVDSQQLAKQNALIQELEAEITRLANVGKIGFDSSGIAIKGFGKNIQESTDGVNGLGKSLTRGLSSLRTIAYILPGIGIAGIFNLAFEGISKASESLDLFSSKLTLSENNLANLNEVSKNAGKQFGEQSTNLKILYQATTDVNNSMHDRVLAARELQKEFPDTFKNVQLETILNGGASESYKKLTQDILDNAKARAALTKIQELAGKQLENDIKIQKIAIAFANENAAVKATKQTALATSGNDASLRAGTFFNVKQQAQSIIDQKKVNEDRARLSVEKVRQDNKDLEAQKQYLIKLAGGNNKIAKSLAIKDTPAISTGIENTFDTLKKQLDEIAKKNADAFDKSGLTGYALDVQNLVNFYSGLNSEIESFITKVKQQETLFAKSNGKKGISKTAGDSLINSARQTQSSIGQGFNKGLSEADIKESQRVANEIQRINDEFGVKAEQSRGRELAQIQALYDAELIKANGNSQTLKTLDEDRLKAVIAINDKYLLIEQDLQDKIQSLNDLAQSAIGDSTAIATARINKEWDSRQQAANKYFQQLQEIAKSETNGLSTIAGFNVQGFVKNTISGGQDATNNNLDKGRQAAINLEKNKDLLANEKQAISGFLGDFVSGLENANSQIGANFASVFSGITASFAKTMQSVAINGISKYFQSKLEAAIAGGTKGLSAALQGAIAGAGIAGSIISGITPQTSVVGQGLGGALSGAASGALIGSVIPGIGTVAGGVIGGVVGLLGGIFGASKAQKELQAQQLAEQKQQTDLLKASLAYTANIIGRNTNQGVITDLNVGAFGQLTARISGRDLQFVLDRNSNGR